MASRVREFAGDVTKFISVWQRPHEMVGCHDSRFMIISRHYEEVLTVQTRMATAFRQAANRVPAMQVAEVGSTKGAEMKTVNVKIKGLTPLLMHADNIEWADQMDEWKTDPSNKQMSKAGDDRTPAWRWLGSLTHDGETVTIPSEYIMSCMMSGAAQVPTGRGKTTFKSQSQSGLLCPDFHWPLYVNGDKTTVAVSDLMALKDKKFFVEHVEAVKKLGFALFVKRAKVGQAKHVRVRPRFDHWGAEGKVTILDETITPKILQQILTIAGRYKGLGDWRPGGKTPGQFGMFEATISED